MESHANYLYGTRITPAVLWEIAPWSWLADYFGNMGDVLTNLSAFGNDNLVCNYAYIMVHTKTTKSCSWFGTSVNNGPLQTSFDLVTETKQRLRAGPYGFAATGGLSAHQESILGALGLSRLPARHG
jgi:hypothetical protein